ncbi:MAG: hypothetical protein ACREV4_08995 [Gammaproteobacteria bacterium]
MAKFSLVALVAICLGGCTASTDPIQVEDDYGNSVRQMIDAQIYDPAAVHNPPTQAPGFDAPKGHNVLDEYRKDVARPKEVDQPLDIRIAP